MSYRYGRHFSFLLVLILFLVFPANILAQPAAKDSAAPIKAAIVDGVLVFFAGSRPVARLTQNSGKMVGLFQLYRDSKNLPIVLQAAGGDENALRTSYSGQGWSVMDQITQIGPRLFRCERTWKNVTGKEQEAVLVCELERLGEVGFTMIPGISYDGNRRWPRARFQGLTAAQMSPQEAAESIAGAQWIFAGDRSSVPACTISEGESLVVGMYAEPKDSSFSACSMEAFSGGITHRLWWPHQEQPFQIVGSGRCVQAPWESVFFRPGDSCSRAFYIAVGKAPEPRFGYGVVLDDAWRQFYHEVPVRHSPKRLWELGIRFAKESLWTESSEFMGFYFSLEPKDGVFLKTTWPWRFEIGFVGQAAAIGAFMIQDFLWNKNEDSWKKGEASLDFWAKNGSFPSGLIYARFDDKLAWKEDPEIDTRNMGDGAYFYLLAAELAEKVGRPRPLWKNTGLGICDFFCQNILSNGRFGKKWKASGLLTDPDGTIGCYLLPAMIKAYRITGRDVYLKTAVRAFRAYADEDLEAVCLTAGAIDQDTVDKETGLPLLTAGLDLYEITKDAYYLSMAEKAAYYLASWQYHYSIDFPQGTPATVIGYDAFGGTSVSVGGGGADQGGAVIALGWLRLYKATSKEVWKQRALATWGHTTIGISEGTLKLNGKVLPVGAQNEGYQHSRTRNSYTSRQGYGNEWLCAWCTAFRLWTLQHWPDWKDLE